MGQNWGRMEEYREFGKVMGGGLIGEFLVVERELGQVLGKHRKKE